MKLPSIQLPIIAGVGTIAIVFAVCLIMISKTVNPDSSFVTYRPVLIACFFVYTACFIGLTREPSKAYPHAIRYALLAIQLLSAFILMWFYPFDFLPILTIIWISVIPYFFSFKKSLLIMLALLIGWFGLYAYHWHSQTIITALLYGTFHFFAIMMTRQTMLAENATSKAQSLNKELQATQQLLTEASKQNERTRIARDLHDLLGHHLTALIINLQVASHTTSGEAKQNIEKCHSLAKLLLSDVREAVSTLRDNQSLNLDLMIDLMLDNVPKLLVHKDIELHFNLDDLAAAKTLLSIIQEALTNSLKHANANEFWITIKQEEDNLYIELYDNGQISMPFIEGNGLIGMRERVIELDGSIELTKVQRALQIKIQIPLKNDSQDQQ